MSTLGEVKDLVQGILGIADAKPWMMNFILGAGRREIEKRGNWYWMEGDVQFNFLAAQQTYAIGAALDINIPAFKDVDLMLWKEFGIDDTHYKELEMRHKGKLQQLFQASEVGEPVCGDIRNNDEFVVYPIPDLDYNVWLYYWSWTDNPAADDETDELLTRWPELLAYAAAFRGHIIMNKGADYAAAWEKEFVKELSTLTAYMAKRKGRGNFRLIPTGPIMGPTKRPFVRRMGQLWW